MFTTLLASRLPPLAWRRPALVAVLLHGAVVAGVAAVTRNPAEPPVERDTLLLQLAIPRAAQDRPNPQPPTLPAPPPRVPALSPVPRLKLEGFDLSESILRTPPVAQSLAAELSRPGTGNPTATGPARPDSVFTSSDVDRPPELAQEVRPRYPDALRETGLTGMVQLEYVIESSGEIDSATMHVRTSTHPAFSRAAIDALLSARFRPALRRGRPVPVRVQQTIRFLTR